MPTTNNTTTPTPTQKTIHIPILYGSQTGNSQSCAESLAESLPQTLSKTFCTTTTSTKINITSTAKQLDDFLEIDRAKWPRLFLIVCSSYGVGQAPIGCWKFRDVCDAILESNNDNNNDVNSNNNHTAIENKLKGVTYAMLGLGDSKYTTFFLNPTALDTALIKAGATRIGSLGKADASGKGDQTQSVVMTKWCNDIIPDVVRFIQGYVNESEEEEKIANDALKKAQIETCTLCKELFEDWEEVEEGSGSSNGKIGGKVGSNVLIVFVVLLAILFAAFFKGQ